MEKKWSSVCKIGENKIKEKYTQHKGNVSSPMKSRVFRSFSKGSCPFLFTLKGNTLSRLNKASDIF